MTAQPAADPTDHTSVGQPYLARRQNWTTQLARHALMQPNATALRFGGQSMTWAQLHARVAALAAALRDRGIGAGDRGFLQGKME